MSKNYTERPVETRRKEDEEYSINMSASLRDRKPEKIVRIGQCASMQEIIYRDPNKDAEHWNRSLPDNWKADRDAKWAGDIKEVLVVQDIRQKGRNQLGDAVSLGATSVSKESKEHAISAYTCSPPADLGMVEKDKIKTMVGYTEPPIPPSDEPLKASFKDLFLNMFKKEPKKEEIDKNSAVYSMYKALGGKDFD